MSVPSPLLQTVLVIGPNWVGDAVMSTPVLANLRRGLPKATIDLLVPASVSPLFDEHPHVDRVLIDRSRTDWRAALSLARTQRQMRYDVALLLPNSFRAALWAWLIGAQRRVGYATDGRRWLLTHPMPAAWIQPYRRRSQRVSRGSPSEGPHQVDAYLRLVEALHIPIVERLPVLVPSSLAEKEAEHLWARHGLEGQKRIVGLCPGAAFGPAKRWWPERFAALADRLVAEAELAVVLFGSRDEVPLIEQVRAHMSQHAVSLAGQDTLASFAALAARCAVLVTNDSGAMHIASAVGSPVVALFGPTDPRRTAPSSPRAIVLRRQLPCSPCFRSHCPYSDHPCMRLIEVDDAFVAVQHALGYAEHDRA
ncbi:MAG TPA: lipopolysaccharide heptosyltransferase II [Alphaproteobacteria bacterium]|nr:lipopolysaccharide heptosyltransferase II [Alphaproteobacteria bacterium]